MWIPVHVSWRLNERHYGALQGMNKEEVTSQYGVEQVMIWRRSFATPPPPVEKTDPRFPGGDPRYAAVSEADLPLTESLSDTVNRLLPYWHGAIAPAVQSNQRVIIVAHGNSLRALLMYLKGLSEQEVMALNIPTGIPLVCDLDSDLRYRGDTYLGDAAEVERAIAAVTGQISPKKA
jgi:2,3-bisphosphoglycerate-dependent phosphoglycerate mutase